jgi:hypothetical protein
MPARANANQDGSNRARTEQQKNGGAVAEQQSARLRCKGSSFPSRWSGDEREQQVPI